MATRTYENTISPGGAASRYTPASVEDVRKKQQYAQKLGLDLGLMEQFTLNPAGFREQYGKYLNTDTGQYTIPGVTPGALMVNPNFGGGSVPLNPDQGVVAAGSSPGSINYLPPYLQPGTAKSSSASAMLDIGSAAGTKDTFDYGAPPALGIVNQMAPIVPQTITPQGSPLSPFTPNMPMANRGMGGGNSFESTAKLLQLPYYLRNLYGR